METYLAQPSGRIGAVDALRGFDMFWITGGTYLVREVCHWIGWPALDPILRHIRHSAWNGCTAYDVIFPLFLFIVGVSMTFSITRRLERGENRATLLRHIVRRTLTIFILGLVYNFTTHYDPSAIRIMGVHPQRIALCYGLASLVVLYTPVAGQWAIGAGLLVGYWLLMTRVPVPGVGAGVLTPEGNLAGWLDRQLLPGAFAGYGFGDNEGLLSTLPAIVNTLAGVQGGPLAARPCAGQSQSAGAGRRGDGESGRRMGLGPGLPDQQTDLEQFLCRVDRGLEPAGAGAVLLPDRRARMEPLVLALHDHRHERADDLFRAARHAFPRLCPVGLKNAGPMAGCLWPGLWSRRPSSP